jgi:SAM-dependent methyltransferase
MNRQDPRDIYDRRYAATYDDAFILGEHYLEATEYELGLLREWIRPGSRWLDVACGTGWFLHQFPDVERCGLDLAPEMLIHARRTNPDVTFVEGDFLDPRPEWRRQWDFVSSMWWAYCYCATVADVDVLIRNLASWTAPGGRCFLPICDPEILCNTAIPHLLGGSVITGVVWTWTDQRCGTRHENLVAPHLQHLLARFGELFEHVTVLDYPVFRSDAIGGIRRAIVADSPR